MNLGIYGTGGAGKEVFELLERCNDEREKWDDIIFIDDTKEEGVFLGCEMLPFSSFCKKNKIDNTKIVIAVGEPLARDMLYKRVEEVGYQLASIIHPSAMIGSRTKIGEGVIIQDYVCVSVEAKIGNNVCINGRTVIGHNVKIGNNCQISSHVIIGGNTTVGDDTFIGMAASVRDHIEVGKETVISMGAVVMKDAKSRRVYMGNPAREIAESNGKVFS